MVHLGFIMETLETIEKVFAINLRKMRGNATQADMAERLELQLRAYQHMEAGEVIPQAETRRLIAKNLKISETSLFLDPDLTKPTFKQALEMVRGDIDRLASFSPAQRALFDLLPSVDEEQARRLIELIETRQRTLARNSAVPKKHNQG